MQHCHPEEILLWRLILVHDITRQMQQSKHRGNREGPNPYIFESSNLIVEHYLFCHDLFYFFGNVIRLSYLYIHVIHDRNQAARILSALLTMRIGSQAVLMNLDVRHLYFG